MPELVRDVMNHEITTCRAMDTVKDIAQIMVDNNSPFVIVVDSSGEAWGVVTELIILKYLIKGTTDLTAEEVMSTPVITVEPTISITEAAAIMIEKDVHHLLLIHKALGQNLKPVAIISAFDIIRSMSKSNNS